MPLEQRQAEGAGDLPRELGLAGAGLALDEQRPLQRDGGVDRDGQVGRGDVVRRAFEFHRLFRPLPLRAPRQPNSARRLSKFPYVPRDIPFETLYRVPSENDRGQAQLGAELGGDGSARVTI